VRNHEGRANVCTTMQRSRVLVLCFALAVLLAACGTSGADASVSPDGTASPGGSASPGETPAVAGLRYACGEVPFDPAVLAQPGGAENGADPVATALREHLAEGGLESDMLPDTGWILVGATPIRAEFVAPDPAGGYAFVSVESSGGAWEVGGWGGCRPHAVLPGRSLASWLFDPAAALPDEDSTRFAALVTELACTGSTEMGARLQPPTIVYGETDVIVIFSALPLGGDAHDCAGNPSTPVVVELSEPLGDRLLLDGSAFPPADPAAPPQ
jgi:hypothetical protein